MDIGDKLIEAVSISSIATIVSTGLVKVWTGKKLRKQINKQDIAMAKLSDKLQKDNDKYKFQIDSLKEFSMRYSEQQFKLYTELWSELYSLKVNADELWDNANHLNLKKFVEQLKQTTDQVNKNSLLIERGHLSELLRLFREFGEYHVGKQKLIEYEYRDNGTHKDDNEIFNMILDNGDLKKRYSKILDELEIEFRRQLKYYVGPTKL